MSHYNHWQKKKRTRMMDFKQRDELAYLINSQKRDDKGGYNTLGVFKGGTAKLPRWEKIHKK